MINPFKHAAKNVGGLWQAASESDCAPGEAKLGVLAVAPLVYGVSLVTALFKTKPKT